MKRFNTLSSNDLAMSDDMANALTSLRSLIPIRKQETSEQKDTDLQEKKLNQIFLKTKGQRIRDIFFQKLKRTLPTNKPEEVKRKSQIKGPCGILVEAFDLPEKLTHIIIFFNVIVVLILIVLATFQGFIQNFRDEKDYAAVLTLKIICLFVNVAYFILKCSNKSFGSGQNLTYIHEVLKTYAFSGRLFLDFLTIAIEIVTLIVPDVMWISGVFFFFLIIVLFFTLSDLIQIQAAYLHSEKAVLMWGLVKICLSNIIFAHFMASFILAMSRIDMEKNWMTRVGVDQEYWHVKYFYAFYWGTTIMMTVGFGDVLPGNPREVIITSFLEMFSCILLGYNISEIGHLISQLREKNEIVNKKLAIFDRMVKSRPVVTHFISQQDQEKEKEKTNKFNQLQKKIYNHIKQLNNSQNNMEYQLRSQLLAELPEHLRKAYYLQSNQRIYSSVAFFNRLKPNTVQEMAQKFQSKLYYAGQNLFESRQKILILQQGQIGYGYKKRGSSLNGQVFDQITVNKGERSALLTTSFLTLGGQKNYDLIAKDHSVVWGIDYSEFMDTISLSVIDFQYYFSILHKHTIDEDQWNCLECPRCSTERRKIYHCVFNCPRIVYSPLRQITVLKNQSLSDQRSCKRQPKRKKRNQQSKTTALSQKKTFSKLLERIDIVKKNIAPLVAQKYDGDVTRHFQQQQVQIQKNQHVNFTKEQIIDLMQIAIRRYETGYEQGFWELETDLLFNYQFYFPNYNVNRLVKTRVHDSSIQPGQMANRRKFMGKMREDSQDSIVILAQ